MVRTKRLTIRLSTGEFLRLAGAAEALSLRLTVWLRYQALRAVEGPSCAPSQVQGPLRQGPDEKLTRTANTKLTEKQFEALDDRARTCGLTVSGFVRQLILGHRPIARRPLARSAIVAVNRVGANLNRLVQLASSGIVLTPDLMDTVTAVLGEIHSLRDALLREDAAAASDPPE
jgi:hypothetical protein